MKEQHQLFDVCIVCALYEEASVLIDELQMRCAISFTKAFSSLDQYEYRWSTIQNSLGEPLTVLVSWLPESGSVRTGLDLKPLLQEFHPRFAAMTGFCAGYKEKVHLGDLVIAEYAYHYEEGKILDGPDGQRRHQPEMKTVHPTTQMIQYAKGFDDWQGPVSELKCRLLKDSEQPERYIAPIASGMAVHADNPFPWFAEYRNRKTIALDMEAATFYLALRAFPDTHALVVKGVCDYADTQKNDDYHDYASRASSVYMLHFIQTYVTEQTMPRRNQAGPSSTSNVSHLPNLPPVQSQNQNSKSHYSINSISINHGASAQLEQIIQNFKLLRSQIASYGSLKRPKGFTLESCENQYNKLYGDAIVFLALYLPECVSDDSEGFMAIVQRKSVVELYQRSNFSVYLARQVLSTLANFEKLAAQINACIATLESYKQKYFA